MDIIKVFGDNLKKYRKAMGISQEAFADKCGMHRTYISAIECYRRSISLENIQRIADALEIETYKLFLEDLENELINKIRKTPYWDDFSNERKTDMIANYFDNKLKKNKYFKFSQSKKDNFVQTVLVLSNNR